MSIQGNIPRYSRADEKKGKIQRIKEVFGGSPKKTTDRMDDAYGVLKEVGGIRPIFNIRDVEQRRQEILDVLTELTDIEFKIIQDDDKTEIKQLQKKAAFHAYKMAKLFQLYFATGAPWVRGLDNRELSQKTSFFIMNYEEVGDIPEFLPDLHAEATQLLSLSWQGVDVTNTPGYMLQSTPVIMPVNVPRINMGEKREGEATGNPTEQRPRSSKHEEL